MDIVDKNITLLDAFRMADGVLMQGVQGISDLITTAGLINVDFADVKSVMKDAGTALMGIGSGVGENRAQTAARSAVSSSLLETSIKGAKGLLFNIIGGTDLTMNEVYQASDIISKSADADANIIFGATIDESLVDQIKISVIATGFDETRQRLQELSDRSTSTAQPPVATDDDQDDTQDDQDDTDSPKKELSEVTGEEEQDEFDIPAFLRQGR